MDGSDHMVLGGLLLKHSTLLRSSGRAKAVSQKERSSCQRMAGILWPCNVASPKGPAKGTTSIPITPTLQAPLDLRDHMVQVAEQVAG